jgi:hypothetical protein
MEEKKEENGNNNKKKKIAIAAFVIFLIAGFVALFFYLGYKATHITTDDAFVDGRIYAVAPKISGTVKAVHVEDNQLVKKGDILVGIAPEDYDARLNEALSSVNAEKSKLAEYQAKVKDLAEHESKLDPVFYCGKPGIPRIGFYIVDVRDLADLHIRAMISPEAAGQRFIAAGDFMWMKAIASTLRSSLGADASKVPTRGLPDFLVRFLALFIPALRMLTPVLGLQLSQTSEKARRVLGFSPRPAATTIVDCARSLIH